MKYKIFGIKSKSTDFLNTKKQLFRKHEDVCIFYNSQVVYNPQMISGKPYNGIWRNNQDTGCYRRYNTSFTISDGKRYLYDIFFDEQSADDWLYCKTCEHMPERSVHTIQKSVELGQYLIHTYTKPGAVVLDNACGSGSFLEDAIREDRCFIGIEKNQGAEFQR